MAIASQRLKKAVFRLRKKGLSYWEIEKQLPVSRSQAQRWVVSHERETGRSLIPDMSDDATKEPLSVAG